jgi:hypothetical protein
MPISKEVYYGSHQVLDVTFSFPLAEEPVVPGDAVAGTGRPLTEESTAVALLSVDEAVYATVGGAAADAVE